MKYHRLGGSDNRNFLLTVLRPGIQEEGAGVAGFWGRLCCWLADGRLLPKFPHDLSSVRRPGDRGGGTRSS